MEFTGIRFGDKHSYDDWGLFLTRDPVVPAPSPRTYYTQIPGGDGNLDLTDALTGEVTYDDRTATFSFALKSDRNEWPKVKHEILNYLHGEKIKVILDNDPDYYYLGRMQLASWNPKDHQVDISISGVFEPFKYEHYETVLETNLSNKKTNETYIGDPWDTYTGTWRIDFGVGDIPVLDLSLASALKFVWLPSETGGTKTIHIYSQIGTEIKESIFSFFGIGTDYGAEIKVENLKDDLDVNSVVSISVSGVKGLSVYIVSESVSVFAEGSKYVSPITIDSEQPNVIVFSDGYTENLLTGTNRLKNIEIPRSGTDLLFYSDADSGKIKITYHKGWL